MENKTLALKLSILYLVTCLILYFISDKIIYFLLKDSQDINTFLSYKIYIIILFTTLFLYYIIKKISNQKNDVIYDYKTIINSSPSPMILFNEDGEIQIMNKAWLDLTEYDFEEINTIEKWTKKAYLEDYEKVKKHIDSLYNTSIQTYDGEYEIHTKSGKLLTWHFSIAPYKIENGKKSIIATALDVTQLKDKEKMLMQQSKMAAMGEILENIAHQWRQPLSTISTASTGVKIQKEIGLLQDEFLIESMDAINNSAQHLSKTIEDFRKFFKPDQEKQYFSLLYSYEKVMAIIGNKFIKENIEFVNDIEDFKILNYDNALIQVFMNLFNNSRDALEERKITKKLILISIYKSEYSAVIQIKDNAGGIPYSILKKVFDPYFTTKHQSQGTGIGLYMTQEIIVKHMNGKIKVENSRFKHKNEKYIGALFTITLPMKS